MAQRRPEAVLPEGAERPGNAVLFATILVSGVVFIDSTAVNVALPAIGRNLRAGLSDLQWIVDGYILTLAVLLIPAGSLGDLHGRRRITLIGLATFALASLACALAISPLMLVVARAVQGACGALLVPASLALLRATYPAGEARGRAVGLWSGWSGITTIIGPLIGGWMVDHLTWRAVFLINLPITALGAWILASRVPESVDRTQRPHLDWIGSAVAILGLGGVTYGLIEGSTHGWTRPDVVVGLIGGLVTLPIFLYLESRMRAPLVPLQLFRSRNFTGANLATLGLYFSIYGMSFVLVIYIQTVLGYNALTAGMTLAPVTLLMVLLSPRIGRLAGRFGPRAFMTIGPLLCAAGLLLFLRLRADSTYVGGLLPAVFVFGSGLSLSVAPLTNTVISAVPEQHAGVASGFNNVAARVAAILAIAGLGAILATIFSIQLDHRLALMQVLPQDRAALEASRHDPVGAMRLAQIQPEVMKAAKAAYTAAFHWAIAAAAATAAAGGIISFALIRNRESQGA